MIIRPIAAAALAAGLALSAAAPAVAQTSAPAETVRPAPGRDATGSTGTLSDKLEATDGVIRPPAGISPDIATKPPVPDPGTTTVIRPGTIPQQPAR